MIHKYFLLILTTILITKNCSGLSLVDLGLTSTKGLSHLCNHLHMGSAQAETPLGIFSHKTYKNLSVLFGALHNDLAKKKFISKQAEYICTQVDLLNPTTWVVFCACGYVLYKAVAYSVGCVRALRNKKNNTSFELLLDGKKYIATPTS